MTAGTLTSIPLSKVQVHTANTRRPQTSDGIKELAASTREQGVLEPIIAFLALAGSLRVAAAKMVRAAESRSSSSGYEPRKKTGAEIVRDRQKREREFRETMNKIVAGGSRYSGARYAPTDVEKMLTGSGFTSDKAVRVLFLSYTLDRCGGSAIVRELVRRVLSMKPNDLRAAVLRFAAREVNDRLVSRGGQRDPYDMQFARFDLLKAYGQKVAEPKPKQRAKRPAKR